MHRLESHAARVLRHPLLVGTDRRALFFVVGSFVLCEPAINARKENEVEIERCRSDIELVPASWAEKMVYSKALKNNPGPSQAIYSIRREARWSAPSVVVSRPGPKQTTTPTQRATIRSRTTRTGTGAEEHSPAACCVQYSTSTVRLMTANGLFISMHMMMIGRLQNFLVGGLRAVHYTVYSKR
jgi:hypothetical protein